MLSIGKYCALLIILSTAVGHFAAAQSDSHIQPECRAKPVEDQAVQGRASAVTFPDGRRITVVGHKHGERQIYDIAAKAEDGHLQKMSNAEFEKYIREILATNSKEEYGLNVLRDARQDAQYFERHASKSQFIGFEGSQQTLVLNIPRLFSAYRAVIREFEIRRTQNLKISEQEFKDAMLSSINGHIYSYFKNPELFRTLPLVGTEDDSKEETLASEKIIDDLNEGLQSVIDADNSYWAGKTASEREKFASSLEFKAFVANLKETYNDVFFMTYRSSREINAKIEKLNEQKFPWLKDSVPKFVKALNERLRVTATRDFHSAQILASQRTSGIHFVGKNHLVNTVNFLEQLCTLETEGRGEFTTSPNGGTYK